MERKENPEYLTDQIVTYLGNKRALLDFIGKAVTDVCDELGKPRLDIADVFSGTGIVARFLKRYSGKLIVNDLEGYSETLNRCYLANRADVDIPALSDTFRRIKDELERGPLRKGFITELYSPEDDTDIKPGERVFYTTRNAMYIDTARQRLEELSEPQKTYLLAPLIYEASVHNNTSGVFKGFYKNTKTKIGQYGGDAQNALSRIMADIELRMPIFSNFSCDTIIYREDAKTLAKRLQHVDLAYLDPPYNEHPYGSNYFMLNLINDYIRPTEMSRVSGIPKNWNRSAFNFPKSAKAEMQELCELLDASYLLISFNDEGFITIEEMIEMLNGLGTVKVLDRRYNTFKGCRNLGNRETHVREYLFLVKKK